MYVTLPTPYVSREYHISMVTTIPSGLEFVSKTALLMVSLSIHPLIALILIIGHSFMPILLSPFTPNNIYLDSCGQTVLIHLIHTILVQDSRL